MTYTRTPWQCACIWSVGVAEVIPFKFWLNQTLWKAELSIWCDSWDNSCFIFHCSVLNILGWGTLSLSKTLSIQKVSKLYYFSIVTNALISIHNKILDHQNQWMKHCSVYWHSNNPKMTTHFIRTETISHNISNWKENSTEGYLVSKINICIYRFCSTLLVFQWV